jgi:hypothetical protein
MLQSVCYWSCQTTAIMPNRHTPLAKSSRTSPPHTHTHRYYKIGLCWHQHVHDVLVTSQNGCRCIPHCSQTSTYLDCTTTSKHLNTSVAYCLRNLRLDLFVHTVVESTRKQEYLYGSRLLSCCSHRGPAGCPVLPHVLGLLLGS